MVDHSASLELAVTAVMDGYVGVVVSMPTVAMLLGSAAVFVCRLPDKVQAGFQMFSAGLLISAVANELFPLLKPTNQVQGTPWPLLIGFTVGIIFMFGLGHLTEFMEDDDDEDESESHDQCDVQRSFP
eukprot:Skav235589  [mRNA]  locus=scaffold163:104492:112133:+ [translate_table: standard]